MNSTSAHLFGDFYEIADEDECWEGSILEAIVREDRIAFDFNIDHIRHNATLLSKDGYYYQGWYGTSPKHLSGK